MVVVLVIDLLITLSLPQSHMQHTSLGVYSDNAWTTSPLLHAVTMHEQCKRFPVC